MFPNMFKPLLLEHSGHAEISTRSDRIVGGHTLAKETPNVQSKTRSKAAVGEPEFAFAPK